MKKYELIESEFKTSQIGKLYRIRALIDIPQAGVKAGEKGGYVESESNLSHEGSAWVGGAAHVFDAARVYGNAIVYDHVRVDDAAQVSENAQVSGSAQLRDMAQVCGNAQVGGNAKISGNAQISGRACVTGNAWVSGDARVDNASLDGNSCIGGDTHVIGTYGHCDESWTFRINSLEKELQRLKRVLAGELSENDELGSEYTYVNALKEEIEHLKTGFREQLEKTERELDHYKQALEAILQHHGLDEDDQYSALCWANIVLQHGRIARAALEKYLKGKT